ncbi:MAG: ribonuclease III [Cytophagales bacterium]|nr:ribonuclease III [Cytophagales bacterium]
MSSFLDKILSGFGDKQELGALKKQVKQLIGEKPDNIDLYVLSMTHNSVSQPTPDIHYEASNERLEFLGDAVLGAVIAEFLFKKFPYKEEGFLTEIRSRLVNGDSLADLCKKVGLSGMVKYDKKSIRQISQSSIFGDAMEAFIGAVYLDKGFVFCRRFILKKLIEPHFDLISVVENNTNYKSRIIEWAQGQSKRIRFEIVQEEAQQGNKLFTARIVIDSEEFSVGKGISKKKAEQEAARRALEMIAQGG